MSVAKTRGEIEELVQRHGATEFSGGWSGGLAMMQFMLKGRRVRFSLELPDEKWARAQRHGRRGPRKPAADLVEAESRRRWRCLLLAIKAKLEVVETGIATFDEEFLAHIVVDDQTVYQRITQAMVNGRPLLAALEKTP